MRSPSRRARRIRAKRRNQTQVLAALGAAIALCAVVAGDIGAAPLPSLTAAPAPQPTPPADPALAADGCGGTALAKPDGSQWECTFDDEFDGTAVDRTKWSVMDTATVHYHSGKECYVDSPNNVSEHDGWLNLTVRAEASSFSCGQGASGYTTQWTSGMVYTLGTFAQAYGRYEIRARFPATKKKGLQESLWLFPVNREAAWPSRAEIDIGEAYSLYPDRVVPYVHYTTSPIAPDPNVTNNKCILGDLSVPHTYVLEWTPQSLTMTYDGQVCLVDDWNPAPPQEKPQPFDEPFFLAITQALVIYTNGFNPWITPLPATTSVDYVRIWK